MKYPNTWLPEIEAAIKLGVTLELLWAYTRYAPKTKLGDKRKLPCQRREGLGFVFPAKELEEWDQYLRDPWANKGNKRPKIPAYIDTHLKVECGGKCALCGTGHKLENAHIIPYEESLSHHHRNLIRICTDCHKKYDEGILSRQEIQEVKKQLVEKIKRNLREKATLLSRSASYHVPRPSPLFVGREAELTNLKEQLISQRVVIVEGVGGIGKTQLVVRALKEVDDIPTVWLDIENHNTISDLEIDLLQKLAHIGLQFEDVRLAFALLSQQTLRIVFDGLERLAISFSDQVVDFLTDLISMTEQPKFVITTQIELISLYAGAYRLLLNPLSFEESEELLRLVWEQPDNQKQSDDSELMSLIRFCDGHPLSLKLSAGLLRYYKDAKVVAKRLREFGADELKDPTRKAQKRLTSLEVCLQAAYSCFNHPQKRLLQYVSNFPAGCITKSAENWQKSADYDVNLAELRRFFFVQVRSDPLGIRRIHLLNPVRAFVRLEWKTNRYNEAAEIQLEVCKELAVHAAFVGYKYFDTSESNDLSDLQWGISRIEYDLHNYIHALTHAKFGLKSRRSKNKDPKMYLEIIAMLVSGLEKYFFLRGIFNIGISFSEAGIEACEELGQYSSAATHCMFLLQLQRRIHDYKGVEETTKRLTDLAQKTSDDHIQALAEMSRGDLAHTRYQFSEAIKHYTVAANHFRNLVNLDNERIAKEEELEDPFYNVGMLSLNLFQLGRCHETMKTPQLAFEYYSKAVDYQIQINDFTNIGSSWHHIANCYVDLGKLSEALECYQKAAHLFASLGHGEHLTNSLSEIGKLVIDLRIQQKWPELLSPDLLNLGLDAVRQEIEIIFSRKYLNANAEAHDYEWEMEVFTKTYYVIQLISFTSVGSALRDWSTEIAQTVLGRVYENIQYRSYYLSKIYNILSVAYFIGEIISHQDERQMSVDDVENLGSHCYLFDCVLIETFNFFEWIAAWLRHWQFDPDVTAGELRDLVDFFC